MYFVYLKWWRILENNLKVKVEDVTVRFNLAKERVDSIKEYVIKLFKGQLFFQEFFALKNISFEIKSGEVW